jgi:hypothetical protein
VQMPNPAGKNGLDWQIPTLQDSPPGEQSF